MHAEGAIGNTKLRAGLETHKVKGRIGNNVNMNGGRGRSLKTHDRERKGGDRRLERAVKGGRLREARADTGKASSLRDISIITISRSISDTYL